ncbi:MerR family transcriptional regulator [Kitasatospora sp. NPDC048194]|uniref:MerR family transcriptional regulator n=1 Tax=Kitasatospora sp. NPDC048194 TaxID=3364045 RepID=UPI003710602F
MNGETRPVWTIGELARRTGLTVKTVRFYSDQGIVSPADRNPAGHRRYGADAVARLDLVRTLRELGLGLPEIRRVLERERALPDVAAAHAEALDLRIRVLRLRRAVLGAVARNGSTTEELTLVHRLARLTGEERQRLVGEFLAEVFGPDGRTAGAARSLTPELPEDATVEQVEAWVELARLAGDGGFRELLRGLAAAEVADCGAGAPPRPGLAVLVRETADPAAEAGVEPRSPEAAEVVAGLLERYAALPGVAATGGASRARLLERLRAMADPRRERYLTLLAVINGWAPPEGSAPVLDWAVQALTASAGPGSR